MTRSILQRILRRTAEPSSTRAGWKVAAATVGMALAATSATAAIVATAPAFIQILPPMSVELGQRPSDVELVAFDERQCFWLDHKVTTDHGVIPAFTRMSSHFLHGDPYTTLNLDGKVRFDNVIIGVISTTAGLDATDVDCGAAGTTYPTGTEPNRGLEASQADAYQIIAGGFAIEARMQIPPPPLSFSDQIRVLTRCDCDGDHCDAD
jgi:hypothetical protein